VEPEEVAAAFDELETSGKVRAFGVSNHKPSQIELLKKYVRQELMYNQLQFSLAVSNMVANGMEVNMETAGSYDHDGSVLDYCRIHDITIQAWSPFQKPGWKGVLIGDPEYAELNQVLNELSVTYDSTPTTLAAAWILRHPAGIQIITGTASEDRLQEISAAESIELSREDWYRLYLAAGHILP
jgi:predicted oxidoreductase